MSTTTAHRRASMLFRASVAVALLALTIPLATTPARAAFPGANGAIVYERNGDIFRRAPDGTTRNLTSDFNLDALNPAVSQDGKWIVFEDTHDLHLVRANGTDRRRINIREAQCPYGAHTPAWSPNGARIAFLCQTTYASLVYTLKRDGTGYDRVGDSGYADMVAWSPNGTTLAWTDGGVIYMAPATGGVTQVVHDDPPSEVPGASWQYIDWSPDSQWLVAENMPNGLYRMPIGQHVEGQEVLVLDSGTATDPVFSPSGTRVLYADNTSADPTYDLFSVKLNGTDIKRITAHPASEVRPEWVPRPQQ